METVRSPGLAARGLNAVPPAPTAISRLSSANASDYPPGGSLPPTLPTDYNHAEGDHGVRREAGCATTPSGEVNGVVAMILAGALYLTQNKWTSAIIVFISTFTTVHFAIECIFAVLALLVQSPGVHPASSHNHLRPLCLTERSCPISAQIGVGDHIPRWAPGTVLKYVICAETFPSSDDAVFASSMLNSATREWKGIGARFELVQRDNKADFRVVYRERPIVGQYNTLASAFFPNDHADPEARSLYIYAHAFDSRYRDHLHGPLAHEVGHILGLRHEFALEREGYLWSTTWMGRNPNSVMEYYPCSSMFRVNHQDLRELCCFYTPSMTAFGGRPVRDFIAPRTVYPKIANL